MVPVFMVHVYDIFFFFYQDLVSEAFPLSKRLEGRDIEPPLTENHRGQADKQPNVNLG